MKRDMANRMSKLDRKTNEAIAGIFSECGLKREANDRRLETNNSQGRGYSR